MKNHHQILPALFSRSWPLLALLLFSASAAFPVFSRAQVPEFNATTNKSGKIVVDEDYDPPAGSGCIACKDMATARHNLKGLAPGTSTPPQVIAGLETMRKALNSFITTRNIKSEDALQDYNLQLILLFDRLDSVDNSATAVERMAAYAEDPEAKAAYKKALSQIPETIRKRVIERINEFNNAQDHQRRTEAAPRKPSSSNAR